MMKRAILFLFTIGIALIFVVVIVGATITQPTNGLQTVRVTVPQGETTSAQLLRFSNFTYTRTDNELREVALSVLNTSAESQAGMVWFLLAPVGSTEPWRNAVYTSPEQPITAPANATVDLHFEVPQDIPEGEYTLSAWAHGFREGVRFHSDGAGAPLPIYIGPPYSLAISNIDLSVQIDDSTSFEITIEAANHTAQETDVILTFSIIASEGDNFLVGNGIPLYVYTGLNTTLSPNERITRSFTGASALPAGQYGIIAWLRTQETDQELSRLWVPNSLVIK